MAHLRARVLHSGPAVPTSKTLLAALALICCAACTAPITDMRPPSALVREDRQFEAGGGAALVTPRPYVTESSHGEGQLWFTDRIVPWLSLSGIVAFDASTAKAGVAALARYVTTDRFIAGVGAEAGYAWYAGSLSAAGRLFDDTWIYVAPRIYNWGIYATPGIPAGVTARIYRGFHLRAEAQLSWQEFKYYNRRLHLSAAAVYEW